MQMEAIWGGAHLQTHLVTPFFLGCGVVVGVWLDTCYSPSIGTKLNMTLFIPLFDLESKLFCIVHYL